MEGRFQDIILPMSGSGIRRDRQMHVIVSAGQ
jgi:hypothetical protein